jgi:CelD/BcsL family acetyltransferase involved in cellulose biosynthesis
MRHQLEIIDPYAPCTEILWRALELSARPSYFLTWGWIENWLAMLPREEAPSLALLLDRGESVAACFLGRRTLFRHRVLPSRALFLNATGVPSRDELCIEHNGLLGRACSLRKLIELLPGDWDELFLPGVDREAFDPDDVPAGFRVRAKLCQSPYVDLAQVRASGDYLALLSANTRAQIRRARRRVGPCHLEVAQTPAEALAIYEELVALHTLRWRARGEPGAFADPWFDRFHRRLIQQRFAHGEIQLVRLRSGEQTIGCLYNLVASGRVLFYQSGLAAFDDPVVKPGLLCHAAAVERNAAGGHAVYDLLGGVGRYKGSLATGATQLAWLCVQRARLRFAIEDHLRDWKQAVAGTFAGAFV